MNARTRPAGEHDAPEVADLLRELGYPCEPATAAAHINRFNRVAGSRLVVAVIEPEQVVGLVATHIVPRLDDDAFTCRITDIVVAGSHRRLGIGSLLVASAASHALEADAPRLDLSSGDRRSDAHAFYLRHGFEVRAKAFTKRLD